MVTVVQEPTRRGDILVSFEITFPEKLSQNTKDLLHDLLPNKAPAHNIDGHEPLL